MSHPDLPPAETVHDDVAETGGRHPHIIGIMLIVAALLLINCSDAIAKLVITEIPVFQLALFQAAAMVCAVPVLARTRRFTRLIKTRRPWLQLLRSACQFGSALCFYFGLSRLPLPDVIAIIMVGPLMVTALAALVLRERVGMRRWVACAFGLIGALIVVRPGFEGMGWPALLPIGAVAFFSVYVVCTRLTAPYEHTGTMMFWGAIVGLVALAVAAPFYWVPPSPLVWLGLACVAVMSAGSNGLTIRAYAHAPASLLAPFAYIEIVGGTILGYLIWRHFPDGMTWVGIAVIVSSGLYVWHRERVAERHDE
jgi:drug/metabolite transporter (DMT)-like permease